MAAFVMDHELIDCPFHEALLPVCHGHVTQQRQLRGEVFRLGGKQWYARARQRPRRPAPVCTCTSVQPRRGRGHGMGRACGVPSDVPLIHPTTAVLHICITLNNTQDMYCQAFAN